MIEITGEAPAASTVGKSGRAEAHDRYLGWVRQRLCFRRSWRFQEPSRHITDDRAILDALERSKSLADGDVGRAELFALLPTVRIVPRIGAREVQESGCGRLTHGFAVERYAVKAGTIASPAIQGGASHQSTTANAQPATTSRAAMIMGRAELKPAGASELSLPC
jgi:hypothetical protein